MNGHANERPRQNRFPLVMVWTSFYEQLAWIPLLVVFAAITGSPEALAFATSAYSASNMAGNALFGVVLDRTNRMKVAGFGFLALALTSLAHLWITSPSQLITTRLLHGLAASAIAPAAFASLAAGAPRERRGEVMARAGLVIALASMVSPALNGRLHDTLGIQTTITILAAGIAIVGVLAFFQRSSPAAEKKGATSPDPSLEEGQSWINGRLLALSCGIGFSVMFCQNVLFYAFPLKMADLEFSPALTGALLSAFAVGAIIAFLPPLSRLSDRLGRRPPIFLGLCVAAFGFVLLGFSQTTATIVTSLFCYGLGFGLVFPSLSALNADAVGPARRGMAFGLLTAMFSAGSVTGPLVTHGLRQLATPFMTGAVVLLITAVVAATLLRPNVLRGQPHVAG